MCVRLDVIIEADVFQCSCEPRPLLIMFLFRNGLQQAMLRNVSVGHDVAPNDLQCVSDSLAGGGLAVRGGTLYQFVACTFTHRHASSAAA